MNKILFSIFLIIVLGYVSCYGEEKTDTVYLEKNEDYSLQYIKYNEDEYYQVDSLKIKTESQLINTTNKFMHPFSPPSYIDINIAKNDSITIFIINNYNYIIGKIEIKKVNKNGKIKLYADDIIKEYDQYNKYILFVIKNNSILYRASIQK